MRSKPINYLLVGSFILAMLVGLVALLIVLSGRGVSTHTYFTHYPNVAGLTFGTPVFFEGYQAGQIEAIRPEPTDGSLTFEVEISLDATLRVPEDSIAEIVQPFLLSGRAISLKVGISSVYIEPDGDIIGGAAAGLAALPELVGGGQELVVQATVLLAQANGSVTRINEWLDNDFPRMIGRYEALPETIQTEIAGVSGELRQLLADADAALARANAIFADGNVDSINRTLANIETASGRVDAIAADMQAVGQDMRAVAGGVRDFVADNKPGVESSLVDLQFSLETVAERIDAVTYNLEGTSQNMYEFSRQIRLNPGLLLGGTAQEDDAAAK